MVGLPRILMAMGRDGLLPSWTGRVNARTGTPLLTTVISAVVVALAAGLLPLNALASLTGVGTLTAFTAVCIAVVVMRKREPDLVRPFRVPGPNWVPLIGAVICGGLIAQLLPSLWLPLSIWIGAGLAVYALFGFRNSTLRRNNAFHE
jgi:APA family basic amino acid/polyamine antiporter